MTLDRIEQYLRERRSMMGAEGWWLLGMTQSHWEGRLDEIDVILAQIERMKREEGL